MPDMTCKKCKTEYHVCDEYIEVYKDAGKMCGCGTMMDVVVKEEQKIMEIRV